jgi:hypothetical protein
MRTAAKWIGIGWSIFCLIGVIVGLANVSQQSVQPTSELAQAGQAVGLGCGMAMWVGIWAAIALPALLIWVVSSKQQTPVLAPRARDTTLCKECGRYYERRAETKFCPNCGTAV